MSHAPLPDGAPVDATTGAPPPKAIGGVGPHTLLSGRYQLRDLLAAGGMAQVWEADDQVLRRKVAVKVLHPHLAADQSFVARFRQEAVAAARLTHPGIVAIYDTSSQDGTEAIVMELVTGRTLRDRLDDPTPIQPWQAAGLVAQVAEALSAAHDAGIVHRDIKPANVLLVGDGRVKVTDFGIAKALADVDLTQPGLMVGTAKYLAPEQVRGEVVDARADIYALGVVLYEMLCGRVPFAGETDAATALARLHRDPLRPRQVRPGVPKTLEGVVLRAMAREPDQRYSSAADLRASLLAAGASSTDDIAVTTIAAPPPASPEHRSEPAAVPPPRTEPDAAGPTFGQTERGWLIPTLILVTLAGVLALAGVLLQRSGAGNLFGDVREAIAGSQPAATEITIERVTAFDPTCDQSRCVPPQRGGDGSENDGDAALAVDADPSTGWETEGYDDRDITLLKPGVGLALELDEVAELDTMELDSPTNDWRAEVYVASMVPPDLAGWGEPVAVTQGIPAGRSSIDLGGATGRAVLLWIVDRGEGDRRARINDVRVTGR